MSRACAQAYEAKGGALKDWQQSQVELAAAQGGLRSATAALAAVRDRFRIFGKSDAEIDALEGGLNGQQIDPEVIVSAPIDGTITQRDVAIGQYVKSVGTTPQPTPCLRSPICPHSCWSRMCARALYP